MTRRAALGRNPLASPSPPGRSSFDGATRMLKAVSFRDAHGIILSIPVNHPSARAIHHLMHQLSGKSRATQQDELIYEATVIIAKAYIASGKKVHPLC